MNPSDAQQPAVEAVVSVEKIEIDFLQLARDADAGSTSWFDTNIRKNVQMSLDHFYGRHLEGSYYTQDFFRSRSKLFIPKTRANIRKHEAMAAAAYFSTQDVVSISAPNDDDPVDQAAASYYSSVMNLRLTGCGPKSIPWFKTVMGAYQDSMVNGVCVSHQKWNFEENKPESILIPIENFRFDPACNWMDPVNSSPFLIWKRAMSVGDIRRKVKLGEFQKVTDAQIASAMRPEDYGITQARNQGRVDPNQRPNSIKEFDLVWVHMNIIRQEGVDWFYYTLGPGQEYLTLPKPLDQVFLHGIRPFTMGVSVIEAHKNYPSSLPQMTRDIQSAINLNTNQRVDNVRLALDKRYFVRAGANVDRESITRNSAGSITLVTDVERDVKVVSTPDVNPSSYKEQSLFEVSIDDLMGGFNTGTMQSNRSLNETVGGMQLISQGANQVAEYQLKTFNETWVERTLFQLLELEKHYNTDPEFIVLAMTRGKVDQQITFDDIRMRDVMLTVQVGMGATSPAVKLEKLTMGMNAFISIAPQAGQLGLNLQEVGKEIFGALGYRDGARFFDAQVDPQVQMLQQQIDQLKQELANKRNPEVESAQAELLRAQAFKTRTEGTFGNVQAAQVVATMPAIAPIADQMSKVNGFDMQNGDDPNIEQGLPQGVMGSLMNVANQDPDALVAAHEQAKMHKLRGNTDPLEPATGMRGMEDGIRGGQQ